MGWDRGEAVELVSRKCEICGCCYIQTDLCTASRCEECERGEEKECPDCDGEGREDCEYCGGNGVIYDRKET